MIKGVHTILTDVPVCVCIVFVAASHQTGLDTKSKA